jgi:hypothetical protein
MVRVSMFSRIDLVIPHIPHHLGQYRMLRNFEQQLNTSKIRGGEASGSGNGRGKSVLPKLIWTGSSAVTRNPSARADLSGPAPPKPVALTGPETHQSLAALSGRAR